MATGDLILFDQALIDLFEGMHNLSSDTIKCGMVTDAITPSITTADPRFSAGGTTDFSAEEVTPGGNYPAGGITVNGITVTLEFGYFVFDFDTIDMGEHPSNPTNVRWLIFYNDTLSGKQALFAFDLGSIQSFVNHGLQLYFDDQGVIAFDQIYQDKILFPKDWRKYVVQSTPTQINVPDGLDNILDVEYLGAFRVEGAGDSDSNYAVGTLGYNSANNSIYMAGRSADVAIAEFAVPATFSLSDDVFQVNIATVLQDYVTMPDKKTVGNTTNKITGILHYNGNLIVTSEIWYDATSSNPDNMQIFSDPDNLAASPYKGMLQLEGGAKTAGYMSKIPAAWQPALGGDYLAGWANNYSIVSRYSAGPSLYTFDPQDAVDIDIGVSQAIPSTVKMVFPYTGGESQHIVPEFYDTENLSPVWSREATAPYGYIIPNTDYFLVVCRYAGLHGGLGYKGFDNLGNKYGGTHFKLWGDKSNYFLVFDVNDIVNAVNPWDVMPITFGKWSHPFDDGGLNDVIGAVYDDSNDILFISVYAGGKTDINNPKPMILAYRLTPK